MQLNSQYTQRIFENFAVNTTNIIHKMPPKEEVPVIADEENDEYASAEGKGAYVPSSSGSAE